MSEAQTPVGAIPANVMADPAPAATCTAAAESQPAAKKAPAKAVAKAAAAKPAKETHIADKIKALPRRRVWPD